MKDKFILGLSAGLAGSLVMAVLLWLLNLIPGVSIKILYEMATLFLAGESGALENGITGTIVHFICGSIIGMAMLALFHVTGYGSPLLKGIGMGTFTWFLFCGILARLLNLQMRDTFIDSMLLLLLHIAFGITAGWFLVKYRDREIT
ncbi:DUF6789 family protein [Phosphitispora fastidiosa]|uniref:DUF6789 family protein n=1 Tax=Phosphitispora fastidiosa TaxID=2837202 RepID=UPI001E411769|nr:DUF6789 family protein [Phosphitispora fastidiosa]MBU7008752.1 hypothetical protein [Phosphitispora fastidiosa]